VIGLFDRDVFYKLCCCDLWHEALEALGITEPYRLAATSNAKSNGKAIKKMLEGTDPEAAIRRTESVVAAVPVLSDDLVENVYSSASYQGLSGIDNIDSGEQVLAAILMDNPIGRVLLSGDKRFVRAFRENLPENWNDLEGSIISFEACLLAIEEMYGFDYLFPRVSDVRLCDGSLRNALGINPNRESFREGLISFDPCREVVVAAQ
jgi:hypothetical protein